MNLNAYKINTRHITATFLNRKLLYPWSVLCHEVMNFQPQAVLYFSIRFQN